MPEIDLTLLDQPERGVIGIGEPPTISTGGGHRQRGRQTRIGVRVRSLPITPAKVLAALETQKPGGTL